MKPNLWRVAALILTLSLGAAYVWWSSASRSSPPPAAKEDAKLMLSGSKSGAFVIEPSDLTPTPPTPAPPAKPMAGSSKSYIIITPEQIGPKEAPDKPMIMGSKSGRVFDQKNFIIPSAPWPTPTPTPTPTP